MVKFYAHKFHLEHSWENVTLAVWLKYPNPYSSHVTASDVLSRRVDAATGKLLTTRLIVKTGSVPKWGAKILNASDALILEESEVDPATKTMVTRTRNLSHAKIMSVEEMQTIQPDPANPGRTLITTEARIVSRFGWGLAGRVEGFGLSRFQNNATRSVEGLKFVLGHLRQRLHERIQAQRL